MTRTKFILALPFIGAIGKLIAGEKKEEKPSVFYDSKNKELWWTGNTNASPIIIKHVNGEDVVYATENNGKNWIKLTRHKSL